MSQNRNTSESNGNREPHTRNDVPLEEELEDPTDSESLKSRLSGTLYAFNQEYFRRVMKFFSQDSRQPKE